jgi:hypothetical protein
MSSTEWVVTVGLATVSLATMALMVGTYVRLQLASAGNTMYMSKRRKRQAWLAADEARRRKAGLIPLGTLNPIHMRHSRSTVAALVGRDIGGPGSRHVVHPRRAHRAAGVLSPQVRIPVRQAPAHELVDVIERPTHVLEVEAKYKPGGPLLGRGRRLTAHRTPTSRAGIAALPAFGDLLDPHSLLRSGHGRTGGVRSIRQQFEPLEHAAAMAAPAAALRERRSRAGGLMRSTVNPMLLARSSGRDLVPAQPQLPPGAPLLPRLASGLAFASSTRALRRPTLTGSLAVGIRAASTGHFPAEPHDNEELPAELLAAAGSASSRSVLTTSTSAPGICRALTPPGMFSALSAPAAGVMRVVGGEEEEAGGSVWSLDSDQVTSAGGSDLDGRDGGEEGEDEGESEAGEAGDEDDGEFGAHAGATWDAAAAGLVGERRAGNDASSTGVYSLESDEVEDEED